MWLLDFVENNMFGEILGQRKREEEIKRKEGLHLGRERKG